MADFVNFRFLTPRVPWQFAALMDEATMSEWRGAFSGMTTVESHRFLAIVALASET